MKSDTGFTLIELMVVIAIIAILSVIGISIYTGAQKNARDAVRRVEIDGIGKSIEISKTGKPPSANYIYTQADFESDFPSTKPKDPFKDNTRQQYCIATSDTVRPEDPSNWASTDPCSSGYSVAVDNDGSWQLDDSSTNSLAGSGKKYWKLCAKEELHNGEYICNASLSP